MPLERAFARIIANTFLRRSLTRFRQGAAANLRLTLPSASGFGDNFSSNLFASAKRFSVRESFAARRRVAQRPSIEPRG